MSERAADAREMQKNAGNLDMSAQTARSPQKKLRHDFSKMEKLFLPISSHKLSGAFCYAILCVIC
jgi:hypothetical protein